jgi:hypothetical protein
MNQKLPLFGLHGDSHVVCIHLMIFYRLMLIIINLGVTLT